MNKANIKLIVVNECLYLDIENIILDILLNFIFTFISGISRITE